MLKSKASGAYLLDIGHSSHINELVCFHTSALCDSTWMLHVLPLTASRPLSVIVECAVSAPGRINAAMPVDAAHETSVPRAHAAIVDSVSVFPFRREHRSCIHHPFLVRRWMKWRRKRFSVLG